MHYLSRQLPHYWTLIRAHRPVGTLLLLWPTLWALWLAAGGWPDNSLLVIFCLGTFFMRSAGCIVNDLADRHIDGHVQRTAQRPLVTGAVSQREAVLLAGLFFCGAFGLVLLTNTLTLQLSLVALLLALLYPLAKRYTHWAQAVLGLAFAFGIPMAFAAQSTHLPASLWILYAAAGVWALVYDTFLAMVDRADDRHLPVKSTALLFGHYDRLSIAIAQMGMLLLLGWAGHAFALGASYHLALLVVAALFVYQQWLIKDRDPAQCWCAFLHSQWVGMVVWLGLVVALY